MTSNNLLHYNNTLFTVYNTCLTVYIIYLSFLVGRDERKSGRLLKQDVLEILFQLYPPEGSRITSKRRSTWLTPIIDGEEALKIMGMSGFRNYLWKLCYCGAKYKIVIAIYLM